MRSLNRKIVSYFSCSELASLEHSADNTLAAHDALAFIGNDAFQYWCTVTLQAGAFFWFYYFMCKLLDFKFPCFKNFCVTAQISYEHIGDEFLQTRFYSTYAAKPFYVSVSRLPKTCETRRSMWKELEDLRKGCGKSLSSRNEIFISFYSGIGILKSEPLDSDGERIFLGPSF